MKIGKGANVRAVHEETALQRTTQVIGDADAASGGCPTDGVSHILGHGGADALSKGDVERHAREVGAFQRPAGLYKT